MLDKVGVQPELVRIGKFKSAGDQLLRSDMSVRGSPGWLGCDTSSRLSLSSATAYIWQHKRIIASALILNAVCLSLTLTHMTAFPPQDIC